MKKLTVTIVALLLLVATGALLYKASTEGRRNDRLDAALEEQIKQLVVEEKSAERPLDSAGFAAGSKDVRVYFCRQAVQRLIDKGIDMQEREVSSAITLVSPEKVLQYYTCKASEETDTRWCDKFKNMSINAESGISLYSECLKQYKPLVVIEAYTEGLPHPSIEKFEKKLAGKEYSNEEELLKTARPIFSRSPEACEDLTVLEERLACLMLTSPQDPPLPSEDSDPGARNFFYAFMAFRNNDPKWLEHTADFDLFSIKGALTSEPYCDAAFRQMADMFCTGSKSESL